MSYRVVWKTAGAITIPHPDPGPHTYTYGDQEHTVTHADIKIPDVSFEYQSWIMAKDNGDDTYCWALVIKDTVDPGTVDSEDSPPDGISAGIFFGINDE